MTTIDLDAARVARAEANGIGPKVKLGGKMFQLPPEVYVDAAVCLREGDIIGFAQALFGDKWEAFAAQRPTMQDCWTLVDKVGEMYAVDAGNSSASNGSSPKSGDRSRPTSRARTKST